MYNYTGSPSLNNIIFTDNTAWQGGGMINEISSRPTLTDVIFDNNTAGYSGGGMHNYYSSPTLTNVVFSRNIANNGSLSYGGGMFNSNNSSPTLTNATFSGNSAVVFGGGMFNQYDSYPVLTNVTFWGNSESGIYSRYSSSPTLTNSILWGNSPSQIYGSATVTYSDIQGGYSGTGNLNADPLLEALADNGGFSQTHALGSGSPAIDTANPTYCPSTDQRGFPRPIDGDLSGTAVCDMGAFEYGSSLNYTLTVNVVGSGTVDINPLKPEYTYGEEVILTAIADANWVFTGWSGDASGTDNPLTVTIRGEKNITANFIFNSLSLTVSVFPEGVGSVAINPLKTIYRYGDVVTLTATAIPGWSFSSWNGDALGTDNPLSFTIRDNTSITSNFTQDEYSLDVIINPYGMGSVIVEPLQDTYHYGDVVTLTAAPAVDWTFTGWGRDASGTNNILILTIQDNYSISANFINPEADILYVIRGTNGNCTSWVDACELQTALFNAVSGNQIWVAAATYKPTTSTNRSATFQLKSGVAIYGGFPAAGGEMADRNWTTNITALSGDIGIPGSIVDNSYHVVTGSGVDGTSVLDGFTITDGNADGSTPNNGGGGMYNSFGSPTLTDITFSDNTATDYGGGMYNNDSSNPTLTNVIFYGNTTTAEYGYGGGMCNRGSSNPLLSNVTFEDNSTYRYGEGGNSSGGGMFNESSSPTLTNVTFLGNITSEHGGAMSNSYNSSPILTNVTFTSNQVNFYGGGMSNKNNSNPSLENVDFLNNTSNYLGGGMFNSDNSNPTLTGVTFGGNFGDDGGGGMGNENSSSPTLINVTFNGNSSAVWGGGMFNLESSPILTNVTFSDNTASNEGGGMWNYASSPTLTDVMFSTNSATNSGGGMYNHTSNPTLTGVTFYGNNAAGNYGGGGMYNHYSTPNLSDVTFYGNTASLDAGGMYNWNSSPSLENVDFSNNISIFNGGGMFNNESSSPTITSVTFRSNTAGAAGGGIVNANSSSPTFINVTFNGNSAGNFGGGIWNTSSSYPILTNVTFYNNSAISSGGGVYTSSGSPVIKNSIVWGNTPNQISGSATVTYSDIQGGYTGTGNINADPLLGPLADNGGFTQTHALGAGSPAIDAADTNSCASFDQRYYARPIDGDGNGSAVCDMGAYEYGSTEDGFTVTVNVVGSGTVTVDPLKTGYVYGEVVTLTPVAAEDWLFIGWSGDASGTDNPLTITIDSIKNITANFMYIARVINLSSEPAGGGFIKIEPVKTKYYYGDVVEFTAVANPGWTFIGWSGDATGTVNPFSMTIDEDVNLTANFSWDEYTFAISVNPPGMGSVTKSPSKPYYNYGDIVTLTATPITGCSFSGWSGSATGTDNPLTYTVQGNTSIGANFTQDEYTLTVTPTGSGMLNVDPMKTAYNYGEIVTLTPTADPGWTFAGWGGDASGSESPLTITMVGDTSITATFTQNEYTLSVAVNPFGMGSVAIDPVQATYHYGDIVTLTPTANLGWSFGSWSGDASGADNPLAYTIVGNTTISATFTQDEYTLTVSPVGSGTVTIEPTQATYHYGDVVTLTPTADPGWTFFEWGGDASGSDNPLIVTIQANTSITATFTQDEYTLVVTIFGSGLVSVNPMQSTYHYGDVLTLIPTANPGWTFSGWSGDVSSSENPLTYTIIGNTTISATFTQDEYTLNVTPVGSGTVSTDPVKATYHYGDVVTLTPSPNLGWTFTGWAGDASGSENPLTYTIVGNTSITATFTQDEYTLTVSSIGSGLVAIDPVQATYHYGDIVTLTPTADPGWTFASWGADASGSDDPLTYTIVGDTSIRATFTQDEYLLTVSPVGSGLVAIDPVQATYHYGDIVTLTPTADPGWTFASWGGQASGLENPLIFTIQGNTTISATFTQDEYTLTVTPIGLGTVSIYPLQSTYHYGDFVTLTPTANLGWTFTGWNGDATGSENPLTHTIVGNTTISATFTQNEYTLTITPSGSGTVDVDPIQATYHYGDLVTVTATADPGWTFSGWSGDALGSDNPLTVTITGNTSITTTFTQNEYTLAVTLVGSGTVAVDPIQVTYHFGDVVTLSATVDAGWTFTGWGEDASGSENPLTHTIVGNTTISATFTQDEYTLTVTPVGSGTTTIDPMQATYRYGDLVTLTPTADPGWTFTGWGEDASGSENPLIHTIVGNTSITANFTQDEYTLIVSAIGSGTVDVDPIQATYHYGDVVALAPTADTGWTFIGWGGDASGSENPLIYTIVGNTTISATFIRDEYTLTVTPVGSGKVTVDPTQATYHYGDVVTLTPTADPGWSFFEWGGDASGSDNPLTRTIVGDTSITATFTQEEYSLTVTPIGSGTVTIDPMQTTYHYGDVVTLTPTADPGWSFFEWGGGASNSDSPLIVTIQGDISITATFTKDEYTLTVEVNPEGMGTVEISPLQDTYHYGDEVTLSATAQVGWIFSGWSGNASGTDNPLTVTIGGNTNIIANFTNLTIYLPLILR